MSSKLLLLSCFGAALAMGSCTKKDETSAPASAPVLVQSAGAAGIAGLNWADPRDNFVDDALVLSGLTAGDSYATVQDKTDLIISGFQTATGANTVRLPINPPTATGTAWTNYTGVIDKALSKGMKVILCCWEGNSSRNGLVDDTGQFYTMWQTVVGAYGSNANVYFEVFNEPRGYSLTKLGNLYATWLATFPNVPRSRVLLDGTGYAENITGIGADSRFSSCLLSIHLYDFFYKNPTTTAASWEKAFAANLGSYASRAVLTEWGAFMTTGVNYNEAIAGDVKKSYLLGISNYCQQAGIASVYWPGLRTGDQYSLLLFNGSYTNVTSASGLGRVRFAWGVGAGGTDTFYPTAYYRLINHNSGQVVDINGASKVAGAPAIQYYQNGDTNQQWQLAATSGGYYKLTNRNSGQALEVSGASTTNAAPIIQNPDNGATHQQWQLAANADGYYKLTNRNSSQVLDVGGASTAAAAGLVQNPAATGTSQQWLLWQQ